MNTRSLFVLAVFLLAGCTWVELAPEAKDVVLLGSAAEAQACKRVGQTSVSVRDKVAGLPRNVEKVQDELYTLARNSAARDLNGNAILPTGDVKDGRQTFGVYRCTR